MFKSSSSDIIIRRNRYTYTAIFFLVLAVVFSSPDGEGSAKILFFTSVVLLMCISLYTVISHIVGLYFAGRIKGYSVVSISNFPNPGKTMMDHLKENGIGAEQLKSLDFMVYSLSNSYIKTFVKQLKSKNPELRISLSGKGPVENDTAALVDEVSETKDHFTRHENLIKTRDGKVFIWFEPRHSVTYRKGKEFHSLPFGAFLLEESK